MSKQVILTGLRTNAEYHLGNYLGALRPMVQVATSRAGEYQVNLFAPDLHSFTTQIDHSKFQAQTMHNLKLFAACGFPLDHEDVYLYRQSRIPAHSELSWILSNFTGFGEMSRMVEFKEKAKVTDKEREELLLLIEQTVKKTIFANEGFLESKQQALAILETYEKAKDIVAGKRATVGLFSYPILMSADILLYGASYIPVGEDQRQHLEFTRKIAQRLNNQFNGLFVIPESIENQQKFVARESAPRIRSLRDPSKKMSKSVDDPAGTIQLSDTPDVATKKIMKAETDNVGSIKFDWTNQPGVTNLLQILALLSERPQADVNAEWEGNERYGDLKKAVAEVVSETLTNIQEKMKSIDQSELMAKVESSEVAMNKVANETLHRVQKAIGLR